MLQVGLNNGGNGLVRIIGGCVQIHRQAAVRITGLGHQLLGPIQIIGVALNFIVIQEAPHAAVQNGGLGLAATAQDHLNDIILINGAGNSLPQLFIIKRFLLTVETQIEQAGSGLGVNRDILVLFQILQLCGGRINADINLTVLQGNHALRCLQQGLEDDFISHTGVISPVIFIADELGIFALFPLGEDILAGAHQPGLLVALILPGGLGLDGHGHAHEGVEQLIAVLGSRELNGISIQGLHRLHQAQRAGNGAQSRVIAHSHFIGKHNVISGERLAGAEGRILHQMEDQMVIVGPLPAGSQLRIFLISLIIQRNQPLMRHHQAVVVSLVVLQHGIELIDVGGGANNQILLHAGNAPFFSSAASSRTPGVPGAPGIASTGGKGKCQCQRKQKRKNFFVSFHNIFSF